MLVCYRTASLDPIADPSLKTVLWRDPPVNRPEQTLIGVQYTDQVLFNPQTGSGYVPYVVTNSANWVYAGTGFRDGDSVPGIVGYEADRLFSQYPSPNAVSGTYTLLSHSPFAAARYLVREGGVEPPRAFAHWILSPARLPVSPLSRRRIIACVQCFPIRQRPPT